MAVFPALRSSSELSKQVEYWANICSSY